MRTLNLFLLFVFLFFGFTTEYSNAETEYKTLRYEKNIHMLVCQKEGMEWGVEMEKKGYKVNVSENEVNKLGLYATKKGECLYVFFCNGDYSTLHLAESCKK